LTEGDVVGFEQASIRIEKQQEFKQLRQAISRVFAPEVLEEFLKRLQSANLRIRDFDGVIARRLLEQVDKKLRTSGIAAGQIYQSLALSDQAQIREFYLSKLEAADTALRHKFRKLFQYY
jgi:hypothetical protein